MFKRVIEENYKTKYEQYREFLEKVPLLHFLTNSQKDALAVSFIVKKYNKGQTITGESGIWKELFIVKSGRVKVLRNGEVVRTLETGDYFGDKVLVEESARLATYLVDGGPVQCLVLSRETLQKNLGKQLKGIIEKNLILEALNKSSHLALLTKDQKENIQQNLDIVSYRAGDIVIPEGPCFNIRLYVIITGNLQNSRTFEISASKESVLGDDFLMGSDPFVPDSLVAKCDMKVGELNMEQFEDCICGTLKDVVKENIVLNTLKKVRLFDGMDYTTMKELLTVLHRETAHEAQVLIEEGKLNNCIFIVKRGKIGVYRESVLVKTMTKYGYFGERELVVNGVSPFTYIASGKVSLWKIYNADFASLLSESVKEMLLSRIEQENEGSMLEDFIVLKKLGTGIHSKVYVVKSVKTGAFYALRTVTREHIYKYAIYEHILLEKYILLMTDHPFIAKLVKTFKDSNRLYYLLEYVHGLSLSVILQHTGVFSNSNAQFYIICLVLVLDYLHELDIIYRDLKPANLLIGTSGYMKLIKFSTAKIIQSRTYTIVGTPQYMAPEVITGKGYTKQSDLWSLGICLYEFLYGVLPFGEELEDPYEIYKTILNYNLPVRTQRETILDSANSLISQLLAKFPADRCQSLTMLKIHPWFLGADWDLIYSQKAVPPYVPDIGGISEDFEEDFGVSYLWDCRLDYTPPSSASQSDNSVDAEIEDFKNSIPENWDKAF